MARRLSAAFSPGPDPGGPASESHVGFQAWSLLLPLPVCPTLSLTVSQEKINRIFTKRKKKSSVVLFCFVLFQSDRLITKRQPAKTDDEKTEENLPGSHRVQALQPCPYQDQRINCPLSTASLLPRTPQLLMEHAHARARARRKAGRTEPDPREPCSEG